MPPAGNEVAERQSHQECAAESAVEGGSVSSPASESPQLGTERSVVNSTCLPRNSAVSRKPIVEGEVCVCRVTHTRSLVGKLANCKYLRRWETHYLLVTDECIASRSGIGFMARPVYYSELLEACVAVGAGGEAAACAAVCAAGGPGSSSPSMAAGAALLQLQLPRQNMFCARLLLADGDAVVLQMSSALVRDRWVRTINWKRRMFQYRQILLCDDVCAVSAVTNVKAMLEMCVASALHHEHVLQAALDVIISLLDKVDFFGSTPNSAADLSGVNDDSADELVKCISRITQQLPVVLPCGAICRLFSRYCRRRPLSPLLATHVAPCVVTVLKHNADFSRNLPSRELVQSYLYALSLNKDGQIRTREAIHRFHGETSVCPHPRVLPNIVSTCLGAIFQQQQARECGDVDPECASSPAVDHAFCNVARLCSERQQNLATLTSSGFHACRIGASAISSSASSASSLSSSVGKEIDDEPSLNSHQDTSPRSCRNVRIDSSINETHHDHDVEDGKKMLPLEDDINVRELEHFLFVLTVVVQYEDWRPTLGALLQPIPFPDLVLSSFYMNRYMLEIIGALGEDPRCHVHRCVLAAREDRRSWLQLLCSPSSSSSPSPSSRHRGPAITTTIHRRRDDGGDDGDDGDGGDGTSEISRAEQLWIDILSNLMACCCSRKAFVRSVLVPCLDSCQLAALRGVQVCQDVLCMMLEWGVLSETCQCDTSVTALIGTDSGANKYRRLCDQQQQLEKLQCEGGARSVSLPYRSSDADLCRLLTCQRLGSLRSLSVAFTAITSRSAIYIVRLPRLVDLDLWATQFGDTGLLTITEHLPELQSLNLCETFVTDQSIITLTALKQLRQLNLNSTALSADTAHYLRQNLPKLRHFDVRYTDAW